MRVSIKLFISERKTTSGFPIYVELNHLKTRRRKKIGNSFIEFWNYEASQPLKQHPEYYLLLPVILEYKAKIAKLYYNNYSIEQALELLFGNVASLNNDFYSAALTFCDDTTNGKLYKTILNSFNKVFPGILLSDISPNHAKRYMHELLKVNSANGVHTYMRTLNTLYKKMSDEPNPFKGVRPKKIKTKQKDLTDNDIRLLISTRTFRHRFDGRNTNLTINYYRYYWMLMFYLGGIDFIDLAALRYDKHVINGRIQFNRNKGGTNVFVNNKIFPEAQELLNNFDCYPYLVPIYKSKNYKEFRNNMNKRFQKRIFDLNLSQKPLTKSARYSFINRAQQLLIDERITIEIVGHAQTSTHSIYTNEFPLDVRDKAHKQIIDLINYNSTRNKLNFNYKIFKDKNSQNLFFYSLDKIKFKQNRKSIGGLHFWFLKYLNCKKYEFVDFWNLLNQPYKINKYDKNSVGLDTNQVDYVTTELDYIYKSFTSI